MAEHLNCQQGATDRANDGMHCVPGGIEPRNLVGKKLQKIQNAGNRDDPGIPEGFERLVLRCEGDPMEMDGESGNENRKIKVDAGQAGQTQPDSKKI